MSELEINIYLKRRKSKRKDHVDIIEIYRECTQGKNVCMHVYKNMCVSVRYTQSFNSYDKDYLKNKYIG